MPADEPTALSFVIPVRNDEDRLRRCLESIARDESRIRRELIVVDNGSTDNSVEAAKAFGARVLRRPHLRVAEMRNEASALATGELVAFVDADHELAPGWSDGAVELLEDPAVVAVGAQYYAPEDGTWVQRAYDLFRRHTPGATFVDWLPSGNFVVRRVEFNRVGGFDSTLDTCEDVDLCQRLSAAGGRLLASDRLRSVHNGDPETLKALFLGELWRGRDNLRVSLRGPWTVKTAGSIALPIVNLVALATIPLGLLTWSLGGGVVAAAGASFIVGAAIAHTTSLVASRSDKPTPRAVMQCLVVTTVYDIARSLALVSRAGHNLRRRT